MKLKGLPSLELALWAIWLGSLWFLAILVAPALFKWLPRPEAGLVAGRLFYMMSWFSLVTSAVLLALSNLTHGFNLRQALTLTLLAVLAVSAIELTWLHPTMQTMREMMTVADTQTQAAIREEFGHMHAVSSLLYALKMIAGLAWGVVVFGKTPCPKLAD